MNFLKRNNALFIDKEALSTLSIVQEGLLYPVTSLMGEAEAKAVDSTKTYKGMPMPFSLILAPKGKINEKKIEKFQKGEIVSLICDGQLVGELEVDEIFKIDPIQRIKNIYATTDKNHPAVIRALNRLGEWAVSGKYRVKYDLVKNNLNIVKNKIEETGAKKISGIMLGANPLNRAHERIIRQALDNTDLLIIFLIKPFTDVGLDYEIRKKTLDIFLDNFLPKNRVLVVPFENSYIFAGYNELVLDATLAKNYGCTRLIVGKNHRALGALYSENKINTVFDTFENIDIRVTLFDEYVYCNQCKTLVNTNTCPHGQHHHIHYHYQPLLNLIKQGIVPPTILVRKEISAHIIASLFKNRFQNFQEMCDMIFPSSGLLEETTEEDFYINLVKLYQTTSLT